MALILDDPLYKESKYHGKNTKHPVRYVIFSCKTSLEKQNRILNYLKDNLLISIRCIRKHGVSYYLSSKESNKKVVKFVFDNYDDIKYEFSLEESEFSLNLQAIQGFEPVSIDNIK